MKKIIKKIFETSYGKCINYSLLEKLEKKETKNIFWYPSAWMDVQNIRKFNTDYTVKNDMPGIDLFLHSDYRYYIDLFKNLQLPYLDKEGNFTINKLEGYYLLNEEERIEYDMKFRIAYSNENHYRLDNEPDLWIAEIIFKNDDKPVFIIYTQLENNYLLYDVIKPFNLPVKYVCTNCDGKDEGGNRTSFLEEPFSIEFQKYIKQKKVIWIEGERF